MARPKNQHPTDGELEILQVLWEQQQCTLGEVHRHLAARREVALTTVATMLNVMLDKGLVRRNRKSPYIWRPAASRDATAQGLVGRLLDRVFDGSAERLIAHLVRSGQLTENERAEIRRLLEPEGDDES